MDAEGQKLMSQLVMFVMLGGGCGTAVYAILAFFDNWFQEGLPSNLKFALAQVLSFVIPISAYCADRVAEGKPIQWGGIFLAVAVAYNSATSIHRVISKKQDAKLEQIEGGGGGV